MVVHGSVLKNLERPIITDDLYVAVGVALISNLNPRSVSSFCEVRVQRMSSTK